MFPAWAIPFLSAPGGAAGLGISGGNIVDRAGVRVGRIEDGIARFAVEEGDASIAFYRKVGGAHFHERSKVAFAMTSLDTPVYHGFLGEFARNAGDAVVLDVGCGDGRNLTPWLESTSARIVALDPVFDALGRLRARLSAERPEWLERVALVEGDARRLPVADGYFDRAVAIEALAYLNEDYPVGLSECRRALRANGRLFLSDRDYEGGLLMRLFYFGGVEGLLAHSDTRDIWDGAAGDLVRSRGFLEDELARLVEAAGFEIEERMGISAFSLVLSDMRARGALTPGDESRLAAVHRLLAQLGRVGKMRRSHLFVARKSGDNP